MSKIKKTNLVVILIFILLSCGNDDRRTEKGYILFVDPDHWYFVPSKDESVCMENFKTETLESATQFRPFFPNNLEIIKFLDTLKITNANKDMPLNLQSIKISSVEMDYTIDRDRIVESSIFKNSLSFDDRQVSFSFNVLPITIHSLKAIKCNSRSSKDF